MEQFNQRVIWAAQTDGKDAMEEMDKYVASYRNTPHSTTGEKPNNLMFNREVQTKLPSFPTKSKGKHHQEAWKRDQDLQAGGEIAIQQKE